MIRQAGRCRQLGLGLVIVAMLPAFEPARAQSRTRNPHVDIEAQRDAKGLALCFRPRGTARLSADYGITLHRAHAGGSTVFQLTGEDESYFESPLHIHVDADRLAGIKRLVADVGICIPDEACIPTELTVDMPLPRGTQAALECK